MRRGARAPLTLSSADGRNEGTSWHTAAVESARRCELKSMQLTKTLATNLRVLRELRGRLGQLELAQRVGVSRRTIARLENAEVADPGVDQVRSLAAALRVPFDLLVTRRLVPVTLPVPTDVRDRLEGDEGVALLARIIRAVDETPR